MEITFYKDTNKSLELTYKNENGTVVDLSSYTAVAKFYEKEGESPLLTINSGITLTGTEPNISIPFTVDQINGLSKRGIIIINITSGGITERIVTGNFALLP